MKYAASFASIGVVAIITAFTIQENARQSSDKQIIRSNKEVSKDSTSVYSSILVKPATVEN
jgi:hypothetical protein